MAGAPWIWLVAALVLAAAEMILPGWILLGFAGGAAAVGAILAVGGPLAVWIGGSVPALVFVFAAVSLVSWLLLRRFAGGRANPAKRIEHDINDS